MSGYAREAARLKEAEAIVASRHPRFGPNKRREIVRLLYEISKRERFDPAEVFREAGAGEFGELKRRLLKRRFPGVRGGALKPCLPAFDLSRTARPDGEAGAFRPRRIFVEPGATASRLLSRFRASFPEAPVTEILSLKAHLASHPPAGYNARLNEVFVVEERSDFFKRCPCTRGALSCGYHIFNLSFGCIYDCTYCYLQGYANSPGIILPANLEGFFQRFGEYARSSRARARHAASRLRVGTGEFSDSLMLDCVTQYSLPIIDFFRGRGDALFEFKTKSSNVGNLLRASHGGNIVAGWSLNPQRLIDENEYGTASLKERLEAASRCARAGYRISFHFDPVIFFEGWAEEYDRAVEALFDAVAPREIAWISVGTLRFAPALKRVIESRFPENTILDGELLPGFDGKLRYPRALRLEIYRGILSMLRRRGGDVPLYLCMEDARMWRELGMKNPFG